jgi:predicted enzyme related to lactoylglutathione lyase
MSRVVHFDINAKDSDRAIKFYETIFNWEFSKWEGPMDYWMIKTGQESEPGIDGGMSKNDELTGFDTSVTVDVKSIDDVIKQIQDLGGQIVQPKMAIPGIGWFAQFKDTEGNKLGLMQDDPSAK